MITILVRRRQKRESEPMKPTLATEVMRALQAAQRTRGWNNRNPAIRRFEIGHHGVVCTLYVVPARAWSYRQDQRALLA